MYFLYNSVIIWNKCSVELRTLPKHKFMQQCKLRLFSNVNALFNSTLLI